MKALRIAAAFAVAGLSTHAFADATSFYVKRWQMRQGMARLHMAETRGAVADTTFDQQVDHTSGSTLGTFKQRYFIDASKASGSNAPVFYYICGEATCSGTEATYFLSTLATKYHANIVALEHRYYGKSQPFADLSTDHLQYLTVHNALEDLATFERYAQANLGLGGKWISVGGSYAGALSAYYRESYPDLVVGALSSSGPVDAQENFEQYDQHVASVLGEACRTQVIAASNAVESSFNDATKMAAYRTQFNATDVSDNLDFLDLVDGFADFAVQYGASDNLCQQLTSTDSDPVQVLATYAQTVYSQFQMSALQLSMQGMTSTDPNDYLGGYGARQWMYQSCREFGFFQVAYHDPAQSAMSPSLNLDFYRGYCSSLFGISGAVNTSGIDTAYYQPLLTVTPSNIFFSNGSDDPWSLLSIADRNNNHSDPNVAADLIDGGSHCSDLSPPTDGDSASLQTARADFDTLVAGWLGT